MTANFRERYNKIMSGSIADFTDHEVFELITKMDYFCINTLQVQSCPKKTDAITQWFTCKVDKPTIKAHLKKKKNEAGIFYYVQSQKCQNQGNNSSS